jgi:hypothetical protein
MLGIITRKFTRRFRNDCRKLCLLDRITIGLMRGLHGPRRPQAPSQRRGRALAAGMRPGPASLVICISAARARHLRQVFRREECAKKAKLLCEAPSLLLFIGGYSDQSNCRLWKNPVEAPVPVELFELT